jgi:uncharacterized protein YuzE
MTIRDNTRAAVGLPYFGLRPTITPEVTKMAQELKEALATFAHAPLEEKERMLPIMLADPKTVKLTPEELKINMETLVTDETLEVLVRESPLSQQFCARLEVAAERALASGVIIKNADGSTTVKPNMIDGCILAAIDAEGNVLGFTYKGATDNYKPNKDFIHYAVSKALCTMVLQEVFGAEGLNYDNTYGGGVWDAKNIVRNIRFLESISPALKRDVNLFMGGQNPLLLHEAFDVSRTYSSSSLDPIVYIGAGCAHFTDEGYVDFKDGMTGAVKSNKNKMAGEAERFIGKVAIWELAGIKQYDIGEIPVGMRGYVAESDILRRFPLGPEATMDEKELKSLLD